MGDYLIQNYFIIVRIMLMLSFSLYGILANDDGTGVSYKVLLLVAGLITLMAIRELLNRRMKHILLAASAATWGCLLYVGGRSFLLIGFVLLFEALSSFGAGIGWYFMPYALIFVPGQDDYLVIFLVITFLAIAYLQHDKIILHYRKLMLEETIVEQELKRDMRMRDFEAKAELKKNMLMTENQILEERSRLSQTLHDKLGHNINGSIYQLEAVKVLMDKDTEKSRGMVQAVINQLRTGMDEIRKILRRERPEKKELALLQLYRLCEDCNNKGVETELETEGDLAQIPDSIWEIILDNAFEAVSNSMKYAKCKNIRIILTVMNQLVRCSISDDGVGCSTITDGMGISGMRQRVRAVNGILSFASEAGFTVEMLLPLQV